MKNDPKYLGCFKSVNAKLKHVCNKKSKCNLKVTDLEKEDDNFCLKGLNKHLEVTYECLKSNLFII